LRDGFAGVERNFLAALERNGIRRVDPTGTLFDPAFQQAVGEQATSARPPGTVLQALTSTWLLNGRLLRPAMVIVAKQSSPEHAEQPFGSART
jgi:molecular chaperone GrpE